MAPALIGMGLVKGYAARKQQAALRVEAGEALDKQESSKFFLRMICEMTYALLH